MEYVVVPKRATEAMFMAAMFDTRQPPDLIWDAMVKAAEPRALEDVTKEYFKAGCKWERELNAGYRERVIRELIEKALGSEADDYRSYDGYVAEWLKDQLKGE